MKRLLYILATGILLSACSAQQRLCRILTSHPELQRIDTVMFHDTVVVTDTIIMKPDTGTTPLTLHDIMKMDSAANGSVGAETVERTAESEHAKAALTALGNGQFLLNAITMPDTIIIHDTIYKDKPVYVPKYITATEYREVEVYKMHWYQKMFCWIGGITLIAIIMLIVYRIIFRQ